MRRPASLGLVLLGAALAAQEPWQLGPFERPDPAGPVLLPDARATFECPRARREVAWRELAVGEPAAVAHAGKVHLLFRAQDRNGTSRIGHAVSDDGLRFTCDPVPVLHPDDDFLAAFESAGCENPRVVALDDGGYVLTYVARDGKHARLAVATSRDLTRWHKVGLAFAHAGPLRDVTARAGAIVARRDGERLLAHRLAGCYWMYCGGDFPFVATSQDALHWTPVANPDGSLATVLAPREGAFDSGWLEPGIAVVTDAGILLLFNARNDPDTGAGLVPRGGICAGQALFDGKAPARVLERALNEFLRPQHPFELTGQTPAACRVAGLVRQADDWLLYYGAADSAIGVARLAAAGSASRPSTGR